MRTRILIWSLAALALLQAGCAADFHAGGEHRGVDVGASLTPAR